MKRNFFLLAIAAICFIGCNENEPTTPTTPDNPPAKTIKDIYFTRAICKQLDCDLTKVYAELSDGNYLLWRWQTMPKITLPFGFTFENEREIKMEKGKTYYFRVYTENQWEYIYVCTFTWDEVAALQDVYYITKSDGKNTVQLFFIRDYE